MATLAVSQPTYPAATTPPTQALTTGPDTFPAPGERYLLVVTGATSGAMTITVADPTSPVPLGSTAINDAVLGSVPVTPARRAFLLAGCSRFRNASGNITLSTSGTPTGSNIEIYQV